MSGLFGAGHHGAVGGQFDHELGPGGEVFLHADGTVVLGDDAIDNCQSQTGPRSLGREVGKEEAFLGLWSDSRPAIFDGNFHHVAIRRKRASHPDFLAQRLSERLGGIINEIHHHALHLVRIRLHNRQIGREIALQ